MTYAEWMAGIKPAQENDGTDHLTGEHCPDCFNAGYDAANNGGVMTKTLERDSSNRVVARLNEKGTVWYGFVTIMGYDVAVVALTEDEAKRLLVAEHARYHSTADGTGPDYAAKSWEDLQEKTEAIVRELPIGKVVWP